ncbi:MAG: HlyD family efflux transporter periplasmic adaptor subunit [Cyanobacteria bacterium RM1_2_2]|nr:HlyD family efflux transporter periplasmic adaptor subunit [Cyanobacteria bacterium RM1_2_2]
MLRAKSSPLRPIQADEFLPPVSRWTTVGGLILIGGVGAATILAAIVKYDVAIKAPASIRPSGELRVVQTALAGTIEQINVEVNDSIQAGDVIARLDRTSLDAQQRQLQGTVQQIQLQRTQLEAQIQLLGSQIASEARAIDQTIASAEFELSQRQREFRERQVVTQADLTEAEATLTLATREMQRYQQLVESGAVAQLQLEEKQAAVQTAEAQVRRAEAALNPSDSPVAIGQRQISQATASGRATLATLERERELLRQNRAELQAQLLETQQALRQVEANLQKTAIRSATAGTILRLNLRNPNQVVQSGEVLAEIAPQTSNLVIKARVATQDIDRVEAGQQAQIRVEACPYPDYGILAGEVIAIAPDATVPQDQASPVNLTSSPYFEVALRPAATALAGNNRQCQLQLGMEAEANIISRQETFLQFLLRKARLTTGV